MEQVNVIFCGYIIPQGLKMTAGRVIDHRRYHLLVLGIPCVTLTDYDTFSHVSFSLLCRAVVSFSLSLYLHPCTCYISAIQCGPLTSWSDTRHLSVSLITRQGFHFFFKINHSHFWPCHSPDNRRHPGACTRSLYAQLSKGIPTSHPRATLFCA